MLRYLSFFLRIQLFINTHQLRFPSRAPVIEFCTLQYTIQLYPFSKALALLRSPIH